ncbi:uncharacterized protein EI90DRAFT_430943 [Cantharellus anzutake]|uniref:uncharacterized protein n=1 Tax=Cantharellus anzutake TaxID=1750568 RepID=UPI001902DD7A|nr:uncharacterized protein EI90DRAFT_430943 [Cantharellus anzutake]KAF8314565.1 hypothetical protein EI90DRAFT_430943 [Cantharellus anzutake]
MVPFVSNTTFRLSLVPGFGDAEGTWPYITGDWSVEGCGVQPMPFGGFLFASWVMIAKEAHTSDSLRSLLLRREGTYQKETGGILTVQSELGEPIHKIATCAVRLWKEFDNTVFKLPKEKRAAWLKRNEDSVIEKLNRDSNKPWFAQKKDGEVVRDLGDLTYEETVLRLVCLMYIEHQKRWIDLTLRNPLGDWLRRVEERFTGVNGTPKDRFCKVIHRLLKDTCRLPNGLVRSQCLSFLISMLDSKSGSRRTLFGQRKT